MASSSWFICPPSCATACVPQSQEVDSRCHAGESGIYETHSLILSMNDYLGVAYALSAHGGIGELPPIVEPRLVEDGALVEVLPKWHLRTYNLSILHLGDRYTPPTVRAFKDYAAERAAQMFPSLRS